jgi:predicted nucleic acid-binding protein
MIILDTNVISAFMGPVVEPLVVSWMDEQAK